MGSSRSCTGDPYLARALGDINRPTQRGGSDPPVCPRVHHDDLSPSHQRCGRPPPPLPPSPTSVPPPLRAPPIPATWKRHGEHDESGCGAVGGGEMSQHGEATTIL